MHLPSTLYTVCDSVICWLVKYMAVACLPVARHCNTTDLEWLRKNCRTRLLLNLLNMKVFVCVCVCVCMNTQSLIFYCTDFR
jgi:hypothetical protein